MKTDIGGWLIFFAFAFIGLLMGGITIYKGINLEIGSIEVKCFDKSSNEIIGAVCIEETTEPDRFARIGIGFLVAFILGFLGFMIKDIFNSPYGNI